MNIAITRRINMTMITHTDMPTTVVTITRRASTAIITIMGTITTMTTM